MRRSLAIAALGLGGCSVYDASLLGGNVNEDAGQTSSCTAGSAGCIPSRPASTTSDPADAMDMSFALRDVLLTQSNAGPPEGQPWRFIGFDLDGHKTATTADPNGCATQVEEDGGGPTSTYPIDGVSGIDNQFGAQLAGMLLPFVAPNLQNDLCCMQAEARGTILLRVREWNGQPEDAHVVLSLTTSYDGTSEDAAAVEYDARPLGARVNGYVKVGTTTPVEHPAWAPDTDTWFTNLSDLSSNDIEKPRHVDTDAYVSGGYLVMRLNVSQPVKLYLGREHGIAIGLQSGTLIAHVTANGHLIDQGWIGGRMGETELKDATYRLRANELYSSAALCANDPTYVPPPGGAACPGDDTDNLDDCDAAANVITPLITVVGDVLADGTNNPATRCDALSAGVSFRGVRARAVLPAAASLQIPLPDCGGQSAVFGTPTLEEAMGACEYGQSSVSCIIETYHPWNVAD